MPWVKIDDRLTEHPKVLAAGPLAIAMQVAGLCYCNRELTDGFIPRSKARSLLDWQFVRQDGRVYEIAVGCGMQGTDIDCQWVIDLLLESGMWEVVDGGYYIHDYDDYQPSKEQVIAEREATAKRQAEWRSRHKGSNDWTNSDSNNVSNGVTNDVTNGPVTPAPVPVNRTPLTINSSEEELIDSSPSQTKQTKKMNLTGFREFYDLYPRRVKPANAERAWAKLKPDERQAAIEAIQLQRGWPQMLGDPTFIPHPSTWLEARSWEDEPPQITPTGRSPNGIVRRTGGAAHGGMTLQEQAEYTAKLEREEREQVRNVENPIALES